jgi:hypothetical protein
VNHPDRRRSSGRRRTERFAQTPPDAAESAGRYSAERGAAKRDAAERDATKRDAVGWDAADWDDTVDVICVGSGGIGSRGVALAAATVLQALDLRFELVITPTPTALRSASLATRLGVNDAATIEYLDSVTDDIPVPPAEFGTGELPIRFVDGPVAAVDDVRGTVLPTFNGAALQTWAGKCLAAPGGMLSTKVADPSLTVTYEESGRSVETLLVASVDFDALNTVDFADWMTSTADDHDIWAGEANELQRLIFDSGTVVGAVLGTPSGPRTIRARQAVVLAVGADDQRCAWPTEGLDGVGTAQLAFVTRAASRFGRLELLIPSRRVDGSRSGR